MSFGDMDNHIMIIHMVNNRKLSTWLIIKTSEKQTIILNGSVTIARNQ